MFRTIHLLLISTITIAAYGYYIVFAQQSGTRFMYTLLIVATLFLITRPLIKLLSISIPIYGFCILILMLATGLASYGAFNVSKTRLIPLEILLSNSLISFGLTIAAYGVLSLIAYVIGEILLQKVLTSVEKWLRPFVSLAFGFVVVLYLYLLLVHLSILWLGPILILGSFIIIGIRKRAWLYAVLTKRVHIDLATTDSKKRIISYYTLIMSGLFFYIGFLSFSPYLYNSDDMRNYLTVAASILSNGGATLFPLDILNQAPHAAAYLLMPFLQLSPDYGSLFAVFFFFITVLLIGRYFFNQKKYAPGLLASVLFLTVPVYYMLFATRRPDGFSIFILTLSVLLILSDRFTSKKIALLIGVFMGTALAMKYTAILILPALLFALLFTRTSIKMTGQWILYALATFTIAILPWLTINLTQYSNPVHPLLFSRAANGDTGHSIFVVGNQQQLPQNEVITSYIDNFEQHSYGINTHTPLLERFYRIAIHPIGWVTNNIGPILVLFVLSLTLLRKKDPSTLLSGMSLATIVGWYLLGINQFHYIFFTLPWICIAIAHNYEMLKPFRLLTITATLSTVLLLSQQFAHILSAASVQAAAPYTVASYSKNFSYSCIAHKLNELGRKQPDYIALPFEQVNPLITIGFENHVMNNYGYMYWLAASSTVETGDDMLNYLRKNGITHLIVTEQSLAPGKFGTIDHPLRDRGEILLHEVLSRSSIVHDSCMTIYELPK